MNYLYGSPATSTNYGRGIKLPETLMQTLGRTTDELGVVKFTALTPDNLRTLQVISEEYGLQEIGNPARVATCRLRPIARLEIVFDRAQGTIGKCRVVCFTSSLGSVPGFNPAAGPVERFGAGVHHSVLTEDTKGIDIPMIATGHLGFRLTDGSNEEPVLPVWPARLQLEAGTSQTIVVPLEKTVTVRGRVVDEKSLPCGNVTVVVSVGPGIAIITHTDGEGRYRCNVLKGPVTVSATRGNPTQVVYGSIPGSSVGSQVHSDLELPDCVLASEGSLPMRRTLRAVE